MDFSNEYILESRFDDGEAAEDIDDFEEPIDDSNSGSTCNFECEIMEFDPDDEDTHPAATSDDPPKPRVNTNNVNLSFNKLEEQPEIEMEKEKEVICSSERCNAYLSHIDEGQDVPGDSTRKIWRCKFCGHENTVKDWPDITVNDVAYLKQADPATIPANNGSQTIIFVIDISGSMCSSMRISSTHRLSGTLRDLAKEDQDREIQLFMALMPYDNRQQITEMQQISHVSRMQVTKAAAIETIDSLKDSDCAGLVVFSDKVTVYMDCLCQPIVIEGDENLDKLATVADQLTQLRPIKESKQDLIKTIKGLKEHGQTALGPALYMGISMAKKMDGVSKVILCTDGLANLGVGTLPENNDAPGEIVEKFYIGRYEDCKDNCVSVFINSFEDCITGMETALGAVPSQTGGMIERSPIIDPDLQGRMKKAIDAKIIATYADIMFLVNQDMFIKKSGQKEEHVDQCMIGNVNSEMKKCYSFEFRTSHSTDQNDDTTAAVTDSDSIKEFPFQIQLDYTSLDGKKVTRVWTNLKKVTRNPKLVEEGCNKNSAANNLMMTGAKDLLDPVKKGQHKRSGKDYLQQCTQLLKSRGNLSDDIIDKLKEFKSVCQEISRSETIEDKNAAYLQNLGSGA